MVETGLFSSELVVTNWAMTPKTLRLEYLADNIQTSDRTARINLDLSPMQQLIIPNFVQYLRNRGVPGLTEVGINYVGPLLATIDGPNASKVFLAQEPQPRGKPDVTVFFIRTYPTETQHFPGQFSSTGCNRIRKPGAIWRL